VVTDTGGGTTTILDENGEETELSGDEGTEGEEICLITRGKKGGGK
jgi:Ethanolamine utilization protein EutJ (predicted chaperonin)